MDATRNFIDAALKGKFDEAKKYMEEACDKLKTGHGNISKNCEILNNAINMFQFDQPQLEECKKKKSKYAY